MPVIVSGISLPFTQPPETALEHARKMTGLFGASARVSKRAVDARHKNDIRFVYSVALDLGGDEASILSKTKESENTRFVPHPPEMEFVKPRGAKATPRPVVVGFGPAGMFAALYLARSGLRPLVLERGAALPRRAAIVEGFFKGGGLDPESNIQFGEGGAGAFSDGKLTTRINDPRCGFILRELVKHGAPDEILTRAKPHVGTDLLCGIVVSIRKEIENLGGEIRFCTKLDGISVISGKIKTLSAAGSEIAAENVILAIGHSARDTFKVISKTGVGMCAKPFSVGVRIEHLQSDVDKALYGDFAGHPLLPKAEYLHSLRDGPLAVYTFCMCPGGVVVPAASEAGGVVTNGMSAYARDGQNANSAIVVSVDGSDFGNGFFGGVDFQRGIEIAAFKQAGRDFRAPAQDAGSFLNGLRGLKPGKVTPSYPRGVAEGDLGELFPAKITEMLKRGLLSFDRKQSGFAAADNILVGVETRTSSPVRITRGENLQSGEAEGLFPCGEGAGYAGGIMSAAADGLRCAESLVKSL